MDEKDHRLEEYFERYNALVVNNANLFVEYHTAEDICQETFIRLGEHLDTVDEDKIVGWLLVVSERLAKDFLKKGGKYRTDVMEISEELMCDIYADPICIMEKKEQYEKKGNVLKLLKAEKPKWFDVIHMSYFEDMDNRSIGKELGIKPSLVSKWKERATKWLRDAYEKEYEERDK